MVWFKAFASGFLATLVFHQGLFALFWLGGIVPAAPFNLSPVPPFGVPQVVSLAFFGGLWGMLLWLILGRLAGVKFWLGHVIVGAVGPTAVAMLAYADAGRAALANLAALTARALCRRISTFLRRTSSAGRIRSTASSSAM